MHWDEKMSFLVVGFTNGSCECLRVHTEYDFEKYDEFCLVKRHYSKITGVGLYHRLATLFTISTDKALVLTNISKTDNFQVEEKNFQYELH